MSLRKINKKDIVGKTIVDFDNKAVNVLILFFSDKTKIELWAEDAIQTSYGNIAGIFVDDENNETKS